MNTETEKFIQNVQKKVAITAVGPSALRNQGKGILKVSQDFFESLSLARIPKSNETRFRKWLDRQTEALLDKFSIKERPWGTARKAINLFLRDALYNQYLSKWYNLNKIESWLEVPLDSVVAEQLKKEQKSDNLPKWPGLKKLKSVESSAFQASAIKYADRKNIKRVHVDVYLWPKNRSGNN